MAMPLIILLVQVIFLYMLGGDAGRWGLLGIFLGLGVTYSVLSFKSPRGLTLPKEPLSWLVGRVNKMAERGGVREISLKILDDYIPTAFSYGKTVVLSLGLFEILDGDEILAVAAHEIGHIKNRDTLLFPLLMYGRYASILMTLIAFLLVRSPLLDSFFALMTVGYELWRSSYMREREFKADETALWLVENPLSLKRALEELKYYEDLRKEVYSWTFPSLSPSLERPERTKTGFFMNSHPSYEERILRIIREIEAIEIARRMVN